MRIEKIEILNLNSLYGKHSIDFTVKAFQDNHLFLLWGDMGSGKTTVLDAITLALYGRTSRQKSISKTGNEILSKGTRECSSEVTFQVDGKLYRAKWSQKYNRNGNLNPPERQLCEHETGRVLASQARDFDNRIEALLKLSYEQFSKAVLLEQGKFAEFLNAAPNERAAILEKLTNTEIYSTLSVAAYQRCKEAQTAHDEIMRSLGDIQLMSDEEVMKLKAEKEGIREDVDLLQGEIERLTKAMHWLENLDNARKRLQDIDHEKQMHFNALALFEPQRSILEAGKRAAEIAHLFDNFRDAKKTWTDATGELDAIRAEIPKAELMMNQKLASYENHKKLLEDARQNLADSRPLFEQVRALKTQQNTIQNQYDEEQKRKDDKNAQLENVKKQLQISREQDTSLLERLAKGNSYFQKNSIDENLISDLGNVQGLAHLVRQAADDVKNTENSLCQSQSELENAKLALENAQKSLESQQAFYEEAKANVTRAGEDYQDACNGQTLETLEAELEKLQEEKKNAETVASYEERRKNLREGEACPLCGAVSHPYCIGVPYQISEIDMQIKATRHWMVRIRESKNLLEDMQKKEQKAAVDVDKCTVSLSGAKDKYEDKLNRMTEQRQAVEKGQEILAIRVSEFNQNIAKYDEQIDEASQVQAVCQRLGTRLEKWRKALELKKNLEDEQGRIQQERVRYQAEHDAMLREFAELTANLARLAADIDSKKAEIESIFGDKNVDDEERTLLNLEAIAEREYSNAVDAYHHAETALSNLKIQADGKAAYVSTCTQNMESSRSAWTVALEAQGFGDESAFEKARLPENELNQLKQKAVTLDETTKDIASRAAEAGKALEELQNLNLTEQTMDVLTAEKNAKTSEKDEKQTRLGILIQRLQNHEESMAKSDEIMVQLQKAKQELERWGALSNLIGSADVKTSKFRNFAQTFTFKILLQNANYYLREKALMKRYELISPDDEMGAESLEFLVHDYQTGQIRKSSNLSGGEKFCMSLALALGLAEMASQNVVIDSLFIDEGLGTLDDQTLDTALNMLKTLGSVNRNQLIGIITHVSRAQETVGTVIVAEKLGNGRSRLHGPGCA